MRAIEDDIWDFMKGNATDLDGNGIPAFNVSYGTTPDIFLGGFEGDVSEEIAIVSTGSAPPIADQEPIYTPNFQVLVRSADRTQASIWAQDIYGFLDRACFRVSYDRSTDPNNPDLFETEITGIWSTTDPIYLGLTKGSGWNTYSMNFTTVREALTDYGNR